MPLIFDELASTQLELKARVLSGEISAHLDSVLALHQTDGKGRQGRPWLSGPGNLYFSFYLARHQLPLTWIPHWIAVSLFETLREFGIPAGILAIKWPNDLMVNGQDKIAGILCEKVKEGIVVGVGVNLISRPVVADRGTASLQDLVPQLVLKDLALKFAAKLLEKLSREPKLDDLYTRYQLLSIIQVGQKISWTDLQLGTKGAGIFLRYGDFGELIVLIDEIEKSLFSEEIQLVKNP